MRRFGLGSRTGIDLPAEATGHVPDPAWKLATRNEPWYIGDTYNLSIGQGDLLVTPLQVALYTAEVANGGHKIIPHLYGQVSATSTPTAAERFATTTTIAAPVSAFQTVQAGMRDCVLFGSCRSLSSLSFPVSAKTGTAQWSSTANTHASFAPSDQPQVVVSVLLENGGEGSSFAAPVAKEVLAEWDRLRQSRGGSF